MKKMVSFMYLPDLGVSINLSAIAYVQWNSFDGKNRESARIHFLVQSTGEGFGQAQTLDVRKDSMDYKILEDCLKGR